MSTFTKGQRVSYTTIRGDGPAKVGEVVAVHSSAKGDWIECTEDGTTNTFRTRAARITAI
jgi:hypothetical protein